MQKIIDINLEEYIKEKKKFIDVDVELYKVLNEKELRDGDKIEECEIVLKLKEESDNFYMLSGVGKNQGTKKLVWFKSDELEFFENKKITFDISSLNMLQKVVKQMEI